MLYYLTVSEYTKTTIHPSVTAASGTYIPRRFVAQLRTVPTNSKVFLPRFMIYAGNVDLNKCY